MTFKKIMSMILAITMLMGMVSNGVFVTKTEAVEEEPIFEDVTAPAVGDKVYLAADVNGTLYFFATGTVSATTPYSLPTVTDFSNAKELTLEDPTLATEGTSVGFQMTFLNGTTKTRIYCYDVLTTTGNKGIMDTGTNTANYKGRHTFNWDSEKKQIVKLGNNNVLVAKFMDVNGTQKVRLLGVTAAEAEAEGVYPAKFVRVHQHQYGTEWKTNETNHWHACSCGAKSGDAVHAYQLVDDGDTHVYKCECGQTKDESVHDYASEWKNDVTNHWHECACGAKSDDDVHEYGDWVNDYTAGTRSQTCGDCGYVNTEKLNHVCTESDTWAGDDTHHWKVCTECEKPIESTKGEHSLGNWETNADQHWHTCSGCGVKKDLADHSYGDWSYDLENKTQSRTCSGCGNAQTEEIPFFDTLDSLDEVKAAAANGTTFYLTAVTKEGVRYFLRHAVSGEGASTTKTGTTGSALFTTDDIDHANIYPVSLYAGITENTFAIRYPRPAPSTDKPYCLYIRDEGGEGNVDTYITATGNNATWQARAEFKWDEVNKLFYQEETVNGQTVNYVLALTQLEGTYNGAKEVRWNIAAVPMAEALAGTTAAGKDVYPVRLATHEHHTVNPNFDENQHWTECPCGHKENMTAHAFDTPKSNDTYHWTECACGAKSDEAEHAYTERKSNETHHWDECACGAKASEEAHDHVIAGSDDAQHWTECECGHRADVTAHTFSTVWNKDSVKHWHECACGAKSDDDVHEYGDWVNDYQNNTKTQSCKVCQYANTVELNHTCTASDKWSTDGENHWKVCGECNQIIESTKEGHNFAGAYQQNADGHWHVCSVCQATSAVESHNYENYKYNDAQHWVECACGRKTSAEDHMYGNWIIDSAPTESSAGSRHKECAACKKQVTESIPMLLKEAVYYLTANFGGKDYYFLHTAASTGTFGAHSLPVTDKVSDCTNITIIRTEIDGVYTYAVQYEDADGTVWYLYVNDEGKDGRVDTGRTKSLRNDRTTFLWDAENQRLYQQEVVDGAVVNYVLAIKKLSNDTTEELRVIAVPESELGEGVVAVKLELAHVHDYKDSWSKDASGHWHECACGSKQDQSAHEITKWTTLEEPTKDEAGIKSGKCDVCGYTVVTYIPATGIEAPEDGDVVYLSAEINGVRYYFRHALSGESVGTTKPNSLYATSVVTDATGITVKVNAGIYLLTYDYKKSDGTVANYRVYVASNGTAITAKDDADLINFSWDDEAKVLYQMEGEEKYVLAFKVMKNNTTGADEVRMVAVPAAELSDSVVAVQLIDGHVHSYGSEWKSDATGHWHECACGSKQDQAAHEITKWTTLEEPTKDEAGIKSGKCDVCGYTVVTYIPATGIEAPEDGDVVYLSAEINGVRYYFRHALSGESVGTTKPNSLYATSVVTDATGITVKVNAGIYLLTYDYKKSDGTVANYRVYVASNGTAITAKDDADLINFSWDDEAKVLYQMEGEEKYVLAFKVMKNNTTGADEVRMVAVPAAELSDSVVAVQLIDGHVHSYGSEWKSDETGHWNECDCGAKSDVREHSVSKWTVTKEPTATETGVKTGKCDTCGYQVTAAVPATGALENAPNENTVYNLTGKFESVLYYFLHKNGGTGETGFQSLHVTDAKDTATGVTIVHEEKDGGYIFHVKYQDETGAVWYLYVNDEGADGKMDTGRTKSLRDDRTTFLWDAKNKRLYQDEGGVKYVLALKKLEKTAGGEELRLVAVPETELSESVVAITLEAGHTHSYGSEWKSDATGHWHECACGSKQDQSAHEITEWTVDKEATEFENGSKSGKCDVCGYKVTKTIPATGIVIEAPKDGNVRYLTAEINGVRYYYRHTVSGESVTTTSPYSLYVTSDISKAYPVTMVVDGDVYRITYDLNEKNYRIYINASGVGITAKDDAALIDFSWDDENNCFYQMEGDVKYVLVFKVMVNNGTNAQEIRLAAVPEAELNDSMAIAALEEAKEHSFGEEWKSDDNTHWHECECGARTDEEKHTVSNWTVEKEATDTEPGIKAGVCDICGHKLTKQIPAGLKPGTYYLTGIFGGVQNFFRHTAEGEKVTHTAPYSLVTTNKLANATLVSIDWDEDTNTYTISYFTNRTLYIYVNDEKPEGDVDTGVTSSGNASRTPFLWDTDSKRLYQLEDGVKYVLAFKMMTNNETGAEELRLVAVPETELGDNVVLAQLQVDHIHSYGSEWKSDATSHWHTCDCGAKADENDHNVNDWSVEKEATETEAGVKTGTCAVCGYKVKVSIPATAPVEPPKAGQISYLSVVVDGVRYYFRHTSSGESVTNTAPYSLYATTNAADAIALTVQSVGDAYRLNYNWGEKSYYIYINASGVGITAKEESALIDFHWDAENNVLYQMEGDVKYVLAFKMMSNSSTGAKELRITSVALSEIQAGSDACVAGLYSNNGTPGTGDSSMTALAFAVLALSFCALAVLVIGKKKWF